MGLLAGLSRRIGRDLDAQVHGVGGTALGRFTGLLDETDLIVQARLSPDHQGQIRLRASATVEGESVERTAAGERTLLAELGPGATWRGGQLHVEARVEAARPGQDLAALTVELIQPDPARPEAAPLASQIFSVESRFDANGMAPLEVKIDLG